tara:strand:+ start:65 stop:286 length:222 start_codon:yes stop_codon:yes gene_type:complete
MTRFEQIKKAEKARNLLSKIEWAITELQILPNNQIMTNKIFRFILSNNEDMLKRYEHLRRRKEKIKRFIFKNA